VACHLARASERDPELLHCSESQLWKLSSQWNENAQQQVAAKSATINIHIFTLVQFDFVECAIIFIWMKRKGKAVKEAHKRGKGHVYFEPKTHGND